jgi:tetratricopeptide (TPR) repeat protein
VFQQTRSAEIPERIALFEDAIEIAWNRLSPESALPWLERLRCERPNDPAIVRRVTEVHQLAGRLEATLRMLECELALVDEPTRRVELHRERARILEHELGHPSRAAAALEDAERAAPGDVEVLKSLCSLYEQLGRPREQARVWQAWIDHISDVSREIAARRDLAGLFRGRLANPRQAAAQLSKAAALAPTGTPLHGELLRELGHALRASGDGEAWADCAEQELLILDRKKDVFAERRVELHRELARTYEEELGRPDTALEHLIALVDAGASTPLDPAQTSETSSLLRLLRVQGNWIELETWLAAQLARNAEDPAGWLELARLRDERMHWTGPAADAYRKVLALDPGNLAALRGLRSASERQGDWSEVAQTLEAELEHGIDASGPVRAGIQRRLGDLYWQRLESTTRASRWYASALESNPDDLGSLRSLQQLLEAMEDWSGALDLYDSEIEMLGDAEPARRAEIAIRSARHASERTQQADRAIRSYEYAAGISPLEPKTLRCLADLYESVGNPVAFANTLEAWCDREDSGTTALDHLKLATTLRNLGENTRALERIERAIAKDPELAAAWDLTAQLREQEGDDDGAGDALSAAAELTGDNEACTRLIRAAQLCTEKTPSVAAARLRTAIHRDPGSAEAHARLAVMTEEMGELGEAELSAGRALDLAPAGNLDARLHLRTAMAGGRAAAALGRDQSAVRCFAIAAEIAPDDPDALSQYGKALAQQGDVARTREILGARLAQDGPNPERALQLTLIARTYWQADDLDAARENFEAALASDPRFEPAHEGLVAMWKSEDRLDPGIACLERWADIATTPIERAERLLQAAQWELDADDPSGSAERHLREVLDTHPNQLRPWEALTTLLWEQARGEDALQVASLAINGVEGAQTSHVLSLIQGRALEQIGER